MSLFSRVYLLLLLVLCVSILCCLPDDAEGLTGEARANLEAVLPSSFSDVRRLRDIETLLKICDAVRVYKQQHPVALALLLSYLYLLYQAFPLFMFPLAGKTKQRHTIDAVSLLPLGFRV